MWVYEVLFADLSQNHLHVQGKTKWKRRNKDGKRKKKRKNNEKWKIIRREERVRIRKEEGV